MRKVKFLFIISLAFAVVMMAACSQSSGGSGEEKVVNIGYSGPLSGAAAFYGENTLNGLKMAVDEINKEGFEVEGEKYKLNLVSLDDKYMPNETASNGKRLVQENKTPIIFSPHSGGIAALQVFNEMDNFLIVAYSSEPDITERGNKLTVRIPPSYAGYIEPFSTYAMDRFGKKMAALPPVTQYGKDWAEAIIPYWEENGGEVVHQASIDFSKDTDFFTILTNALKQDPDVLFIGGASEPTAKVAMQARELGFDGGFIIMDQAKLDEMKNVTQSYDVLEGAVGVTPLIHTEYPGTAEFIDKYRELYNKDPGSEAGYHYLATYVLVEAMKAAGNVEDAKLIREHIQAGLDQLPEDKKVYEIPSVEDDGGFVNLIRMATVEDGEIVLKEVD
ncbi:branched-chain amino acid transport system substrate-binding protein [Cytobacillus horneckiae]|uniref:Ethanolamine utilization protein EutJ n=1 Tax=Cytobacillus horneckiae TaxID=549687 RepID=A0A2N0Z9E5_9BACI|nr:ABC transporter substrate-binding protein [Cytobacillus horneckiae]MBN6886564.1 ABC transporter substrate-binding protein [Cytobacillus horneckiae]MEC1159217.1 ABC transporter substrate-binding protein [Cytobacillus horneckiae]MED2935904.1 ABC transporter substrate-binding protein [Cytobacillus horneckiae]PKG26117.1 ethanolamine utilization protein EutJ [Cytobacillus horneckiae]